MSPGFFAPNTALRAKRPIGLLVLLAAMALLAWWTAEATLGALKHPAHAAMLRAARTMQAASAALLAEKSRRGLLVPDPDDPNRTGLIGPEFTETTTSLGVLAAKRTATNPDLAAAILRAIDDAAPGAEKRIVIFASGSIVGGNVAAIAAAEALARPIVLASALGSSMYGATDPAFGWADMEAVLHQAGIIGARSAFVLLGGSGSIARELSDAGRGALREAALRNGRTIAEAPRLPDLIERTLDRLVALAGGVENIAMFINVGGAAVALGSCIDGDRIPVGLLRQPIACADGTPGLIVRFSGLGVPVLHILNLRLLATEWGLPYDPRPLPIAGDNPRVYGGIGRRSAASR